MLNQVVPFISPMIFPYKLSNLLISKLKVEERKKYGEGKVKREIELKKIIKNEEQRLHPMEYIHYKNSRPRNYQ